MDFELNKKQLKKEICTIPNLISLIRILIAPLFLYLILIHSDLSAIILLVLCSISDWLDGFLARKLNQVSAVGKALDPVADRLLIFAAILGITARGMVPPIFVALVFFREFVLLIVNIALYFNKCGTLQVHFLGKTGTALLYYAFPLLILCVLLPENLAYPLSIFSYAVAVWGIIIYYISALLYIKQAKTLIHRIRSNNSRKN